MILYIHLTIGKQEMLFFIMVLVLTFVELGENLQLL